MGVNDTADFGGTILPAPSPTFRTDAWRPWRLGPALIFALAATWSIAGCQISVVLGGIVLLSGLLFRRPAWPRLPATLWGILLFLTVQALSVPFAVDRSYSARYFLESWTYLFPFVFWGLLCEQPVRRKVMAAAAVGGGLAGLYGIVQHVWGQDWLHHRVCEIYGRGGYVAVGNLNGHLIYAGTLIPVFFIALGLALERRKPIWFRPSFWILPALLLALGLVFSYARTAWIGVAVGLLVLGLQRGRRTFVLFVGTILLATAFIVIAEPTLRERLLSLLQIGQDPRPRLWRTALRIASDHPWLGAGPGAFKNLFPFYKVPGEYMATMHPHCDPLNVLVETGLVGLAVWLGIWVVFFWETRSARTWSTQAGRAGIAALLVGGLGQNFTTDAMVHGVWGFLLGATLAGSRQERHERQERQNERLAEPAIPLGTKESLGRRGQRLFKTATLPLAARLFAPGGRKNASPPRSLSGTTVLPAHILIIRQDNRLGNLLLLTPFLRRLRQAAPRSHIAFLSGQIYAPLLQPWPWVDQWIVQEKRRHIRAPWQFVSWLREIRGTHWGLALEVSNHNTHSYYQCLLALASGAEERIGFDHPRSRPALTQWITPPEETLHFSLAPLRILRGLGVSAPAAEMRCPLSPEPSRALENWRKSVGVSGAYLVVHLGGRDSKAYPLSAWADLLPRLGAIAPGGIVLVAGPTERDRLAALSFGAQNRQGRWAVAPDLPISDLARVIRDAGGFLGCDSGVMHLAVSLKTPTVALFFHSNPYHYAPLGERHRTVLLADPYGVQDKVWEQPMEGMRRSPLIRAESPEALSRCGVPETGARAGDAIAQAVSEAMAAGPALAETVAGGEAL